MRTSLIGSIAVSLLAIGFVAGCATPQETRDDLNDTRDDDRTGTPEYVMIDGRPYECHDTVNVDGVCDDYELDEGYTAAGSTMSATSSGGSVSIGGHTYRCDDAQGTDIDVTDTTDDTGRCETYKLAS